MLWPPIFKIFCGAWLSHSSISPSTLRISLVILLTFCHAILRIIVNYVPLAALRLLARRSHHFFQPSTNPFKTLPDYLESVVQQLAQELPVRRLTFVWFVLLLDSVFFSLSLSHERRKSYLAFWQIWPTHFFFVNHSHEIKSKLSFFYSLAYFNHLQNLKTEEGIVVNGECHVKLNAKMILFFFIFFCCKIFILKDDLHCSFYFANASIFKGVVWDREREWTKLTNGALVDFSSIVTLFLRPR